MNATWGIIISIAVPILTAVFVFGVMKGTMNGLIKKVEQLCSDIRGVHERIDGHLEWHCESTPTELKPHPSAPKASKRSHSRFLRKVDKKG